MNTIDQPRTAQTQPHRIGSLNRANPVYASDEATAFAKAYIAAHRNAYKAGCPAETPAEERAAQRFHGRYYLMQTVRSGFAGSGEWLYGEHVATGEQGQTFCFVSSANGSGFEGTDHVVTVLS